MTGTDPAVEAARRAFDNWRFARPAKSAEVTTVTAAREALAPIRELHRCVPIYVHADECEDPEHDDYIETWTGEYVCPECPPVGWTCAECAEVASYADDLPEWPCDTARRCYTDEELNHD